MTRTDPMTAEEFRRARHALGEGEEPASFEEMARLLCLAPGGARDLRRMSLGDKAVSGPISVALDLLIEKRRGGF